MLCMYGPPLVLSIENSQQPVTLIIMRISPALLLILLLIVIFAPTLQDWATQGGAQWYRPYLLWLVMIVCVAWTVQQSQKQQENIKRQSGDSQGQKAK